MKKIIVTSMMAIIFLPSCKNSENKITDNDTKKNEDLIVQENKMVIDEANPSDTSFIDAVDYYQKKKYAAAADYIEWGILQLRQEEQPTDMLGGNLLMDKQVQNLRSLEVEVRNNKIEDINDLTQAMVSAEMLVAHDYIIYSIATLTEAPLKSSNYFDKAVHAMDKTILKLNGDAKMEAEHIRDDSKDLKDKMKAGAKISEKDLKSEANKIEDFLKKHKSKKV
ncbi:MAG: hypothetical protein ABI315_01300 [Bacteroidia bacterium]